MVIDVVGVQALLAENSVKREDWRRLRLGATGALLDDLRARACDAEPEVRHRTWDTLEQIVAEEDRNDFFGLLVDGVDAEQFQRLLTDVDPEIRCLARRTNLLPDNKIRAAEATLATLADDRFDYAWPDCVEALAGDRSVRADATPGGSGRLRRRICLGAGASAAGTHGDSGVGESCCRHS
ncbi:hypothetical protein [Nocardia panacis]|uniref:hypothetical protein n=1 Tax=Nocardia panacis TaxID=2340916 RepID=UPI00193AAA25|nr:hypothetical protein [Nocardia panacis]